MGGGEASKPKGGGHSTPRSPPLDHFMPNNGVTIEEPRLKDYVAGVVSGVVYENRLSTGDWRQWRSTGEKQHSLYFDSKACVSFSFNNNVESQINWLKPLLTPTLLLTLLTPSELLLFQDFFNDSGEADLSDRALAKLSGTTQAGNTASWVSVIGSQYAVPEKAWGYPRDQRTPVFDWNDFYQPIPQETVDKYSKVFFKVFKIEREFISRSKAQIEYHLKQAPIQIASGFCTGWGTTDPVRACSRHNEHATVIDATGTDRFYLSDSYIPFAKALALDYNIDACLKIVVSINQPKDNTMIVKENYLYQLVEAPGGFALGLNGNLIVDDVAKLLASWLVRNGGNTTGKVAAVTKADWDSVKHYNLKLEPIN